MSEKPVPKAPEEDTRELYENAPCGYVSTLKDGRIVRANQTFETMVGVPRAEFVYKKSIQELMTLPGRIFFETHFAPMIRMHGLVKEIACDFIKFASSPMPAFVNAVSVSDGKDDFVRFTIFDATERRRYEAEILRARNRAEQYAVIVHASPDAIFSLDRDGNVLTWNPGAVKVYGYSAAETLGCCVWDLAILSEPNRGEELFTELSAGRPVA